MASYGFCFRPSLDRDDCSGRLLLWIDHCGKTRFVPTTYDVRRDEWDPVSGTLVIPGAASFARRRRLRAYAREMARSIRNLEKTLENPLKK